MQSESPEYPSNQDLYYSSRNTSPFNYMEIINNILKDYDNIQEEEIQLCQQNQNPFQPISITYMHSTHRTLVPIGSQFQVPLPPLVSPQTYRHKSQDMMKALQILKINDPQEGEQFYQRYFKHIEDRFGPGRTYEDVNHLRNAFKRMNSQLTFEEYVAKNGRYWQTHFKTKDRTAGPKVVMKKKKKKGTIPI